MEPDAPSPSIDPYRRRRAAGAASREETRRRLLAAADELFREQGYPATTVAAIALRADVSLQTLYLAWGSKRALLRAASAAAAVASQLPMHPDEWGATIRAELADDVDGATTAAAYLAAVSRLFVRVAERTAPFRRMHQRAAATDPEIATDWEATMAESRHTMTEIAKGIPRQGLRTSLTEEAIADTLWAIASPEVYDLLTTQGGYAPAAFQSWLERTLVAALCTAPREPRSTAPISR
ncbi:MAG: TetR/AcrR family transcriptional regulator [Chloroflexota bacterium]|nr:TetR/AcrR family transcriptional regulator [Chloroflexota bacterium]